MSDTDQSLTNLRYNQVTQGLEGFGGGTPMWTPLILAADGGVSSLNTLAGAITLAAGSNITLTPSGQTITVAATGGGSPGGSNTQIQFNNAGVFGGAASITTDGNNLSLSDNHKVTLGHSGAAYLEYNTLVGSIVVNSDTTPAPGTLLLAAVGGLYFNANTKADGTGTYYPTLDVGAAVDTDMQFFTDVAGQISIYPQTNAGFTRSASAILQVNSTTQGMLLPVMTTTQKDAIATPGEGLMVYDLTLHKLSVWTGSAWETVTSA